MVNVHEPRGTVHSAQSCHWLIRQADSRLARPGGVGRRSQPAGAIQECALIACLTGWLAGERVSVSL